MKEGFFLAIIRLRERFFRMRFVYILKSIFGMGSRQELNQIESLEALDNADDEAWNFSLATLVGKAQN
jgi:hypothetical protein